MAKSKKKKYGKKRIPQTKKALTTKMARRNLNDKLQAIYKDEVSLDTICDHQCACCKVAMPQINYSEFVNMATSIWNEFSFEDKLDLICTSIEYFFRYEYEKWGMESLIKPCMLLDQETSLCKKYEKRPLSCRLYGLWPEDVYNERVDKFARTYEQYGLAREELPLNKQCPLVKRKDTTVELTKDVIEGLYEKLDKLDKAVGDFTSLQITAKENYRTFHDWLLLKIYGEEWLASLTTFMLASDRSVIEEQIKEVNKAIRAGITEKQLTDIFKNEQV